MPNIIANFVQSHYSIPTMQDAAVSKYTEAITEKEWQNTQRDANTNLPKHLKNGRFGEEHFEYIVPAKYIRKIALIIACAVKNKNNNQEYMQKLLLAVFEKLKSHPNDSINKDAGKAMCAIHKCVKLYLDTDFHPETLRPTYTPPAAPKKHPAKKKAPTAKQLKRIEEYNQRNRRITAIPTTYSNGFTSVYREQVLSKMSPDNDYEYGLSDID